MLGFLSPYHVQMCEGIQTWDNEEITGIEIRRALQPRVGVTQTRESRAWVLILPLL